ncbi:MAG: DUF4214 domain-containing protein [Pseudomonadota bacterium]
MIEARFIVPIQDTPISLLGAINAEPVLINEGLIRTFTLNGTFADFRGTFNDSAFVVTDITFFDVFGDRVLSINEFRVDFLLGQDLVRTIQQQTDVVEFSDQPDLFPLDDDLEVVIALADLFGTVVYDLGLGEDRVLYDGTREQLDIEIRQDETVAIRVNDVGPIFFQDLERIDIFDEGSFLFDLPGESADEVYRLYGASLARTPDEAGLRFWVDQVETGEIALANLPQFFVISDEFAELFGVNAPDEVFINALYNNVLQRDADPAGFAFWLEEFESGRQSRSDMLTFFSESAENIELNRPNIEDGFWVTA